MSIDEQQTQTGNSPGDPKGSDSGRRTAVIVGVLVTVLAVAGIGFVIAGGDRQKPSGLILTEPSAAPSAEPVAPTAPALTEEQQVIAQYRKYFEVLAPLSMLPENERAAVLAEVAVDPSYSRTLGGLKAADDVGEVLYGTPTLNPVVLSIDSARASLRDCADGSSNGRAKADGTKVTVGRPGTLSMVTMLRGSDGVWRVSEADYRDEPC